ncbi:MAG TPA: hypothetical protein VIH05_11585 [Tepidiformaceae bacterium]|jgi:hypothetical protein
MRQWLLATTLAFTTVLAVAVQPAEQVEASSPSITGSIQGVEWCPQSVCGTANFSGYFSGKVGGWWAWGVWTIYVNYDVLPAPGTSVPIWGSWRLSTTRGSFSGSLSGTLTNNGDNTFSIAATMTVLVGGSGTISASGLLNHNVFPPTLKGYLSGP